MNTAQISYQDSSGATRTAPSNTVTVTVAVNGGTLPTPTFSLPSVLPVNSQINASEPSTYLISAYNWSFIPQTPSSGSPVSAAGVQARAATANFSTPSGMADLGLHNMTPGHYLITVTATDSRNNVSPPAQANVTLVPADLSTVRVYPNPWRSDKHNGFSITFDHLALNSTVKIFTASGHWVKTLPLANSSATWDLTNDAGDNVAAGIYFYLVSTQGGQTARAKFAIIR